MNSQAKLNVTFLIDSPDSWMMESVKKYIKETESSQNNRLIHTAEDIEQGDILFILSFYKLVPTNFLKLNKHNIVVHASKLPRGKGWSPATWQILEGKNEIPLTLFEAIDKVDAGNIYIQDKLELEGTELINDWQAKMASKIIDMIKKFIEQFPNNKGIPQTGPDSFYPRRSPKDSELDINKTIAEQFNNFRAADNEKYPTFFKYKNQKFILKIYPDNS